ncbi:glycosyltransferase family 4 protein [Chromobacterium violaceum]|uniref:glycosyltransferase family 4 protein n=1 Tax=Chromobacterium violaceum TaxID=536 RepID=UPI001FD1749A|nr:glycosyltransferase family 4 protein [Chromobacterium violaceum]
MSSFLLRTGVSYSSLLFRVVVVFMIRLAIVRQKYNSAGGAERFVSRALNALREHGELDLHLIARGWEKLEGVTAHPATPFYLGNVWRDWGFARAAKRIWLREGFDLVQSHERIPGCDIYRAGDGVHRQWLKLRARRMSWLRRLSLSLNPYHRYVCRAESEMFLHPRLKLVICNSMMVKREIIDYFGLPESRIAVIYNGVDLNAFHPNLRQTHRQAMRQEWEIAESAPLLLYVGSGFDRKGVARALRAAAKQPEAHLMIVGGDKHIQRYRSLARRLGMAGRVRFAGPRQDVKPFYGMADGFILPTLYDPFPNVCIEALASGLPILTTKQCGGAELVRQGENGWVCDALDELALSSQIGEWLSLRSRWEDLSAAARRSAEPLSMEAMGARLLSCYREVLAAEGLDTARSACAAAEEESWR